MSSLSRIRIGTRRSRLAMAQSRIVADCILAHYSDLDIELVPIVTEGDRLTGPLWPLGGKGLFTAELEAALQEGDIQLAVHSAKDMPVALADDFVIAAAGPREDPRDALLSLEGLDLQHLPPKARVGTSSLRRKAQLLAIRDDLEILPLRGNVETRLGRLLPPGGDAGERLDAIVVAMAGLKRLGLAEDNAGRICPLDVSDVIPAAGQGVLAVQSLAGRKQLGGLLDAISDPPTEVAWLAERSVLAELGADCHSCIAVYVAGEPGRWWARGMTSDGMEIRRHEAGGDTPQAAARKLLADMRGGTEIGRSTLTD